MTSPAFVPETTPLDRLLGLIGEALELTPTQRLRAVEEYRHVSKVLCQVESPVARLAPEIYPQGSARVLTEVRPLPHANGDAREHDLDAVAEYAMSDLSAMALYEATWVQLSRDGSLRPFLERKRRCIRLNFKGDFHLDLLPARTDRGRWEAGCIEIPDCDLKDWVSSNPKGFAAWFERQGELGRSIYMEKLRKSIQSLPEIPTHQQKPVLNRVVQLLKRRRDMVFLGGINAPRSIVLTTLAARHYAGELDVAPSFLEIVTRIRCEIDLAMPGRISVVNPTNALGKL